MLNKLSTALRLSLRLLCVIFSAVLPMAANAQGIVTRPLQLPVTQEQGGNSFSPTQLSHWRACIAAISNATGNCTIMATIDSTTMGYGSNGALVSKSWTFWLAQDLNQEFNTRGIFANQNSFCGYGQSSAPGERIQDDPRISPGSWTEQGSTGTIYTAGGALLTSIATGTPFVYTPGQPVDTFKVIYNGSGTATASATVTATGGTAQNMSGATTTVLSAIASAALVSSANTLTMNYTGTGGSFFNDCVIAYNSTQSNINIINAGFYGSVTSQWNTSVHAYSPIPMITFVAPTVLLIDADINDALGAVPLTTFITNVQALIATEQAAGGDVILISGNPGVSNPTQPQYAAALAQLALTDNLPYVDLQGRFVSGSLATTLGFMFDGTHPNGPGYEDIALPIAKVLSWP